MDEKWFINLYIKSYTDIDPQYNDFATFLNDISRQRDILITTGIIDFDLLTELRSKYFKKKSDKIYFRNNSGNSIYLINKPSFEDIESLLRNTRILITCQGSVTHAANSFDIKKIDIIEKNKVFFYQKFTSYLKNYYPIYRSNFVNLKEKIRENI